MQELTQSQLKELLSYDQETGVFTRLDGQNAGKVAGAINKGYLRIRINGKRYYAHRLAWLYVHGAAPKIDGKKRNLGNFEAVELASAAYQAKASEMHGAFYRNTLAWALKYGVQS